MGSGERVVEKATHGALLVRYVTTVEERLAMVEWSLATIKLGEGEGERVRVEGKGERMRV